MGRVQKRRRGEPSKRSRPDQDQKFKALEIARRLVEALREAGYSCDLGDTDGARMLTGETELRLRPRIRQVVPIVARRLRGPQTMGAVPRGRRPFSGSHEECQPSSLAGWSKIREVPIKTSPTSRTIRPPLALTVIETNRKERSCEIYYLPVW